MSPTKTTPQPPTKKTKRGPQRTGVGQPKRPMTGFFCYAADRRVELRSAAPSLSMPEVAKTMGGEWQAMGAEARRPYLETAARDKQRYDAAMASYTYVEPPTKKARKDPNAPKRGRSAYIFFCAAERPGMVAAHPQKSVPELGTLLGAAWQALVPGLRQPYEAEAARDKQRYAAEKAAYQSGALA